MLTIDLNISETSDAFAWKNVNTRVDSEELINGIHISYADICVRYLAQI